LLIGIAPLAQAEINPQPFHQLSIQYQLEVDGLDIGKAQYQVQCLNQTCQIYNQAKTEGFARVFFSNDVLEMSQFKFNKTGEWEGISYAYRTDPDDGRSYRLDTQTAQIFDTLNIPFALSYLAQHQPERLKSPLDLMTRKITTPVLFTQQRDEQVQIYNAAEKDIELSIRINPIKDWLPEEINIRKEGKRRFTYRLLSYSKK
jgi:hypothetical protein